MTAILFTSLAVILIGIRASWSSPCGESLVTTVHPLAERARGRSWAPTAVWFVIATIATATIGGSMLAALGSVLPIPTNVTVTATALVLLTAGLLDLVVGAPPTTTRQLNENWLTTYRGWVIGLGYGSQLGSGFATVVPSWTGYAIAPVLLLAGEPVAGAILGTAFGLGRVLAVAPSTKIRDRSALVRIPDRWVGAEPVVAMATSVGVLGLGAGLILTGGGVAVVITVALVAGVTVVSLGFRRRARRPRLT